MWLNCEIELHWAIIWGFYHVSTSVVKVWAIACKKCWLECRIGAQEHVLENRENLIQIRIYWFNWWISAQLLYYYYIGISGICWNRALHPQIPSLVYFGWFLTLRAERGPAREGERRRIVFGSSLWRIGGSNSRICYRLEELSS